jgi:uncharacterized small protein (DUF1192 family)
MVAGTYYAALKWVSVRHNSNVMADELKRSLEHIVELENRLALLEADISLRAHREQPTADTNGWEAFNARL